MEIVVKTRSASRKRFIEAVASLYVGELGLKRSKYTVCIQPVADLIKTLNFRGGCIRINDSLISVGIDSRLNIEDLCVVLAHEMVHVKQYAFGQLQVRGNSFRWLGRKHPNDYYDAPWEIEAFSRERILANNVAKILQGV